MTPLISHASYHPFGPLTGLTFGNGRCLDKHYDHNYAINAISSQADGLNLAFDVDILGQITAIAPNTSASPEQARQYRYDAQGRLSEVRDVNNALIEAFSYDTTGNRLSKYSGAQTESYSYPSDSHRLIAIDNQTRAHDAVGNLAAISHPSAPSIHFEHGAHNRLAEFKQGHAVQARYTYNAQGERTKKQNGSSAVRYLYTTTGQLIGEYDSVGQPLAEYIYLDTLPVAVFTASGLGYIETDHLGAPRVIIDAASNHAQWHWPLTGSAFGDHAPNPDPHNTGTPYTFNLRYPGQYFDAESGLHYNYFRDYEPQTGRYIQSDPIGLEGGVSTYGYVGGDPLGLIDPAGLEGVGYWTMAPPPTQCDLEEQCAIRVFMKNYRDMRRANWRSSDKYFHCKANCEAVQCGDCGYHHACLISDLREGFDRYIKGDPFSDSASDQIVNQYGRIGAIKNPYQDCSITCSLYRPPGLPSQY